MEQSNRNRNGCAWAFWFVVKIIVLILVIWGFRHQGVCDMRAEAIQRGHARWIYTQSGDALFEWNSLGDSEALDKESNDY